MTETAHLIGQPVIVTFADGGTERGVLRVDDGTWLELERDDAGCTWTAVYTRIGDDDTPAVVSVEWDRAVSAVQTETLW
jgi:hypothetical protein